MSIEAIVKEFSAVAANPKGHKKIPRPNGLGMWWTVQDSNL